MLATSPLTPTCRSGIIITGFLAGSSWATLMYFQTSALLLVLLSGFTGVLVFTVTRFRSPLPWLLALSVLPFLALITLWLDWNFRDDSSRFFIVDIMPVIVFWLFLILPFMQARNWKSGDNMATAVIASLWANSFTVIVATLLTGLFWLVMLLWSNLFGLIELRLFDRWFFYNDIFPPVATGVVIAASIALCRSLPAAGNIFKRVISLMAAVALPLHAAVSLIFLAVLPFTGLIIIPKNVSTVLLLTTMALAMMVMTAIVCSPTATALRYPGWLRKLVVVAQWLMPLFAILAAWALWLRVAQYGWTMDRINAAAVIAVTLVWTVGTAWLQRRAWRDDSPKLDMLSTCVLGLMAILWLLLHSPALDPYRITINNQLSRLEQGLQQANPGDLYMFSIAGRRGHQALLTLQAHPQWLADPAEQRGTLASLLTSQTRDESPALKALKLRQTITLRKGSPLLPESWWQSLSENSYGVRTCLVASSPCIAWTMDLNNDGKPEVLVYDRDQREITAFSEENEQWRNIAGFSCRDRISCPDKYSEAFDRAIQQGELGTIEKPGRDLQIDGQRYKLDYYGAY